MFLPGACQVGLPQIQLPHVCCYQWLRNPGQMGESEVIEIQLLRPVNHGDGAQVVFGEAKPHVLQRQLFHVAGIKPPGGQRAHINARAADPAFRILGRATAVEFNCDIAQDDVGDGGVDQLSSAAAE